THKHPHTITTRRSSDLIKSNASEYYLKKEKNIDALGEIKEEKKLSKKVVFLYFLPVIPYGLIAFTCANSKMKFLKYILITTLGTDRKSTRLNSSHVKIS